jgi:hypothetical protein
MSTIDKENRFSRARTSVNNNNKTAPVLPSFPAIFFTFAGFGAFSMIWGEIILDS